MSAWADHLWQSTLLAGAVLIALAAIGRWMSAAARRALLAATLGQFLLPAAWCSAALRRFFPPAHRWLEARAAPVRLSWPSPQRLDSAAAHRPGWALGITAAWLAGAACVVAATWIKTARLRRKLLAASALPTAELQARLAVAARRAGLREPWVCRVCAADQSPGVVGILSPVLFVPARLQEVLSGGELDAILLHEMIHLARNDNLWSALQTICAALNWYNPVAWLVSGRLQLETEMSCDERVLGVLRDPETYVSGIAKSARHSLGLLAPGFAAAGATPVGLRLGNILAFPPRPAARFVGPAAMGGLAAALLLSGLSGSVTVPARPAPAPSRGGPELFAVRRAQGSRELSVLLVAPQTGDDRGQAPDMMPVALYRPAPHYPLAPRLAGVSGGATVDYTVDAGGRIKDAIIAASDREDFGAAALEAVEQWDYRPAERNGAAVETRLRVKFVFTAETPLPREKAPEDRPVEISFR